ncbi:hypothetical protein DICPUDRAFT_84681 [Dictyostelium purpureum]|uniref:Uncharacterized protein n=1 Tax=Dictyostelium purpureum TaxID=5786 RepID=F1A3E4_DICPU|nr:uncharacterized protein DICPUDRAFT_84681 [Dictyostelium purpureum]EGC29291.1 hypothetical protein DICPUDRAFT_84681 [Dictyostelium purpureum]|eukprot:XP_003294189.1 hypothetical protein DICPUDRAFT_84681 [Dictyostelium purpureum]
MKNKPDNNNESRQKIVSILEDIPKEISKDWEKITTQALFKTKYDIFLRDQLPFFLDIITELENKWTLKKYEENPDEYIQSFKDKMNDLPQIVIEKDKVQDIKSTVTIT